MGLDGSVSGVVVVVVVVVVVLEERVVGGGMVNTIVSSLFRCGNYDNTSAKY